jgi:hypothetical protein
MLRPDFANDKTKRNALRASLEIPQKYSLKRIRNCTDNGLSAFPRAPKSIPPARPRPRQGTFRAAENFSVQMV